jgi:heptosyltransferase-2
MNQLGDLLFSLPAIEAMRRRYSANRFISIAPASLAPLLAGTGLVDEVMDKPTSFSGRIALIKNLRSRNCAAAILFSESPDSLIIAAASIPQRIGFATASLNMLLTDKVSRYGAPSIANNANMAVHLEAQEIRPDYVSLVEPDSDGLIIAGEWLKANSVAPQNVVVLSPGASARRVGKRWNDDKWIILAKMLQQEGRTPVFIGAPREHADLQKFASFIKGSLVYNTQPGIHSLVGLLGQSRLFVGIDSGAMHLAAALNVPVIALFGQTDPAQVGPRPLGHHIIIKRDTVNDITIEDVWDAIQKRLV